MTTRPHVVVGIDQSLTCTGIAIMINQQVVAVDNVFTDADIVKHAKHLSLPIIKRMMKHSPAVETGLVELVDNTLTLTKQRSKLTKVDKKRLRTPFHFRVLLILQHIDIMLGDLTHVDLLVNENISMGSRGQTSTLGNLLGIIQGYVIGKYGADTIAPAPTTLKKFAGHGTYDKDQMFDALPAKYKRMIKTTGIAKVDDMVDAIWLALFAFPENSQSKGN